MDEKALKWLATEIAKHIKTEADMTEFSKVLKKMTGEAALGAELTELKRGIQNILIACMDGLKGFPYAINTVFPQARIQLCIVHLVHNSLKYVSWKEDQAVTQGLKQIYQSDPESLAQQALDEFVQT